MTYDCGVALSLPVHVEEEAYRCPMHMREDGISFEYTLTREYIPHITLYQGRFASKTVAMNAWREAKMAYRKQKRIFPTVILLGNLEVRPNRNVFWNAEATIPLITIHEQIALSMNARTSGLLLPQAQSAFRSATTEERIRIMRFGMLATGVKYCPHVTIGRIATNDDAVRACGYAPPKNVFVPVGFAFGPIDEYGRMKESELIDHN